MKLMCMLALTAVLVLPKGVMAQPPLAYDVVGGQLVGIANVEVDGLLCDVEFKDGSFLSIFGDASGLDFTTHDGSLAASAALNAVVLDSVEGQFRSNPALISGCEDAAQCRIYTPYALPDPGWVTLSEFVFAAPGSGLGSWIWSGGNTPQGLDFVSQSLSVYADWTCSPLVLDQDSDGVTDDIDNCPATSNPDQTDGDLDGIGDSCDTDDDNDGILDVWDNCPYVANPNQTDFDGDGVGDACDTDMDGDGLVNVLDNCPTASNPDQTDTDHDGIGDECDTDDDNDGLLDSDDNCPAVPNPDQEDLDGDRIGDFCDADLDGDGVANEVDNCAIDANVSQDDTDMDGIGDACDPDADNDGLDNPHDNCPLVANSSQTDTDGDGRGDPCDSDLDGDGVDNNVDNCPSIANSAQTDFDGDSIGDACDGDMDADGVGNSSDQCQMTPIGATVDPTNGCSIAQLCPCEGPRGTVMPWRNHGKYVSCVALATNEFLKAGLISVGMQGVLVSGAGQTTCGK